MFVGIFAKKKAETESSDTQMANEVLPPIAIVDSKALIAWFEIYGKTIVDRNTLITAVIGLSFSIAALAFGFSSLLPLKEVRPYVIETNDAGDTRVKPADAQEYTPTKNQVRKTFYDWVKLSFGVEQGHVQDNLVKSYIFLRGDAIDTFKKEIILERKPIEKSTKDASFRINVDIISTNVMNDGTAIVRFRTKEFSKANEKPIETTWTLTAKFRIDQPKDEETIYKNPVGLYIIDFHFSKEFN
jgi:type IV secretion system protein VirB5